MHSRPSSAHSGPRETPPAEYLDDCCAGRPVATLRRTHRPSAQPAPASQLTPQPPQWKRSRPVSVSHPFAGSPSHSARPAAHRPAHSPATHAARVPTPSAQRRPHAPQLEGSTTRSTHSTPPSALGHGVVPSAQWRATPRSIGASQPAAASHPSHARHQPRPRFAVAMSPPPRR
nr:hypothetical protein [Deltaproteobacteria bacterium]